MIDLEQKRKRIEGLVKIGGLCVIGLVVAPFIFLTIQGLLGLVLAAGISFTAINFVPWYAAKVANWRLKAIKHEASKNPIETLQNDLRFKTLELDSRKTNIEKMSGQLRTFADRVTEIKDKYGASDSGYIKLNNDLVDLKRVYNHRCERWKEARKQLDLFGEQIDRGKMIWEAAQAAAAARETSGLTDDEFFSKLRTETAFDSIETSYNQAIASLDASMLEEPVKTTTTNPAIEQERKNKERIAIQ